MSEIQALVTVDTIIDFLQDTIEQKRIVPPSLWLDAASKLNVLLGDESDKLFSMQRKLAEIKVDMLRNDEKSNVSAVRLRIEASEEWELMMRQQAKIKRVEEFIRIAKIQARMKDNEHRSY